jgi:hypothetical protein
MKQTATILFFLLLTLTNCSGQAKYFQPTGIKDRTQESSGKNEWFALNNKERIDGYTRIGDSIFGGEIACNVKPLKDIDVKTFKVLAGTQYAKDTNYVYYPLEQLCVDYTDCGVCYYTKFVVENATPSTFRYLGKEYATDGSNVYFRGELLQGADAATFKVIDGPEFFYFATDKQHVYRHDQIFSEADPATFHLAKDDPRNDFSKYGSKYIIADKNKVWEYTPPTQIKEIQKK